MFHYIHPTSADCLSDRGSDCVPNTTVLIFRTQSTILLLAEYCQLLLTSDCLGLLLLHPGGTCQNDQTSSNHYEYLWFAHLNKEKPPGMQIFQCLPISYKFRTKIFCFIQQVFHTHRFKTSRFDLLWVLNQSLEGLTKPSSQVNQPSRKCSEVTCSLQAPHKAPQRLLRYTSSLMRHWKCISEASGVLCEVYGGCR